MSIPNGGLRWYQFGISTLLILTACTAILCSIAVNSHWVVSVVLAFTALVGGVTGKIVADSRLGFLKGALFAISVFFLLNFGGLVLVPIMLRLPYYEMLFLYVAPVSLLAALIGGRWGGLTAAAHSVEERRRILPQDVGTDSME